MRDPQKILTKAGHQRYLANLSNIVEGTFFIINHADDLLLDDELVQLLYQVNETAEALLNKTDFDADEDY